MVVDVVVPDVLRLRERHIAKRRACRIVVDRDREIGVRGSDAGFRRRRAAGDRRAVRAHIEQDLVTLADPVGVRGAVHGPDCRQAAVVLPKNVGLAVAVEIGRRSDMPRGPNIGKDGAASDRGAVHGPDRRQAAVVLPKNVGLAVAVEIGRCSDMPAGPNIGQGRHRQ